MPTPNDDIQLVQVTMYFGDNPNFFIRADDEIILDNGRIRPPSRGRYTQRGLGAENVTILQNVLTAMKNAYRASDLAESITLCLDGSRIRSNRDCS